MDRISLKNTNFNLNYLIDYVIKLNNGLIDKNIKNN